MFSTRNSIRRVGAARRASIALGLAVSAGLVGCARNPAPAPEPVSTAVQEVDPAMQLRDFPRTTAQFEGTGVEAGATRFWYAPQTRGDDAGKAVFGAEAQNAVLDTLGFMFQTFAIPVTWVIEPPGTKVTYYGVLYDPTHYAMPVMPPDDAPVEGDTTEAAPTEKDAVQDAVDTVTPPADTTAPAEKTDELTAPLTPVERPVITPEAPPESVPETNEPAPVTPTPEVTAPETPAPAPEATEPAAPAPEAVEPAPAPEPEAPAVEDANK